MRGNSLDNEELIQHLIEFIRYDFPRAASLLKYSIGKKAGDEIFEDLLMYTEDSNRQGFPTELFWAIDKLHDIHLELMRDNE